MIYLLFLYDIFIRIILLYRIQCAYIWYTYYSVQAPLLSRYDIGTIKQTTLQDLLYAEDKYLYLMLYSYYRTNSSFTKNCHYLFINHFIS